MYFFCQNFQDKVQKARTFLVYVVFFISLPIAPLGYKYGLNRQFYTLNGILLPIIAYICTR